MFLVGSDQTILEKRRGKKQSVPVFKDIYSVETLVWEYLWRGENLFYFRQFSTDKILPLT